ncbi:hypothetical protein GGR16_002593 [Chelatococcus caeni]|uniref:Uncharacterized protein n=1 Tax=Chelatococcus caeni TaxID=1348468 RepID=A0A840C231_9HYPH|nr:hypothetical protein [Chelatococcus caeni]MBB4017559.1 hypothetical protein [Chelatococcus caeni]
MPECPSDSDLNLLKTEIYMMPMGGGSRLLNSARMHLENAMSRVQPDGAALDLRDNVLRECERLAAAANSLSTKKGDHVAELRKVASDAADALRRHLSTLMPLPVQNSLAPDSAASPADDRA